MALARARMPSHMSDVEAPVIMLILKGSPWACSLSALAAMACVTTLGEPGAVNPEKPHLAAKAERLHLASLKNSSAASSGVRMGNLIS